MDADKLRDEKKKLEQEIEDLITAFNKKSPMRVAALDVEVWENFHGKDYIQSSYTVMADVRL